VLNQTRAAEQNYSATRDAALVPGP